MLQDYDLPERIFIDANIFIYNALDHPEFGGSCSGFLERVEKGEIAGVITPFVIDEVLFKILIAEASKYIGKPTLLKIKKKMKDSDFSEMVYSPVEEYMEYFNGLSVDGLEISDVDRELAVKSVELGAKYGLLIADSMHLAMMKKKEIINIATNDADFKRIEWIKVWKP
ncbi:MAG TPA: PIN domain-containing protein [Euryarchaeota archaeon]|nr:PIN domain protein [archaeon BMS3Bbin15]HDL16136.1 PIN domain-containing protein [Euryarchaeota archaeon]